MSCVFVISYPANMAVKTEKELSEALRALWLKAVAAIELRNFGYAISLLQEILKQEPQFLTGRELLRRAEVTRRKSAKKTFFNISTAPIAVMKAQQKIKKDPKRAVEILEKVLEKEPYNRQANLVLKEAALAAGWPEIAVFALRTLVEENARDVKVLHALGRLYHQLGDSGLAREVSDLKIKCLEREIAVHEEFLSRHNADEVRAKKSEELKAAKAKRAEILIDHARERLARNPTDLQLRFELGENLFNAGRFREALPELQRARQNPHARLKAMNLLGCCYSELEMLDLAVKQLEEASKEILSMDAMKKEIVYNLGLVCERMGEREKSLACMKQIYEVDYGYKDVAQRVESSYEQNIPHA